MGTSWDGGVSGTIFGSLTLTSDLVFRIIVSRAYLLYYLRQEFQIWCVDVSWDDEVSRTVIGSL